MEVQLVEDKVRGLMQDSLAASARTEAVGSDGPNDGEQSGDLGFNGREASKTGDDDLGDREAHAEASAAALTDQVFDISFRHLLRRDPQFHTALRHRSASRYVFTMVRRCCSTTEGRHADAQTSIRLTFDDERPPSPLHPIADWIRDDIAASMRSMRRDTMWTWRRRWPSRR